MSGEWATAKCENCPECKPPHDDPINCRCPRCEPLGFNSYTSKERTHFCGRLNGAR